MNEKEFKKLAANSRDWLIYQLLSEKSKETVVKEIELGKKISKQAEEIESEHVSGVNIEATTKEEIEMDFSQVLVTAQSDKALLVVKKGFQQWLAKSLILGEGKGYEDGNIYDIEIKEVSPKSGKPTKWVFKKWEVFKVVKNRG